MGQFIVIILVIIILIVSFVYFGGSQVAEPDNDLQEGEIKEPNPVIKSYNNGSSANSSEESDSLPASEASPIIQTYIVIGPKQGEIIETNRVVFEFMAKVSPLEGNSRVFF